MKKRQIFFSLLILCFASSIVFSQNRADFRKQHYNLDKQLAIQGYDPVAYFINKKAIKGNTNFKYTYEGIDYWFSSATNLELFKKNPDSFEPAYGGWCAYAMGNSGEKVEIDPATFKIIDNKLYLFYNKFFNNTLKEWNKDQSNLKVKADANWVRIIKK
jgi:YHS domain-containing protein